MSAIYCHFCNLLACGRTSGVPVCEPCQVKLDTIVLRETDKVRALQNGK